MGAVAQLERAKIVERTTRGKRHKLRMGQIMSHGHTIYGYNYIKKVLTTPPRLEINKKEAKVVQQIFDMFANQEMGILAITRWLEENNILTKFGKKKWLRQTVKTMLENETYAGTRYFNRVTLVKQMSKRIKPTEYKRMVEREKSDWIGVKVSAIVSKEVFQKAQEKILANKQKYRQPIQKQLLSELVECGECGRRYSSSRRYVRAKLKIGIERIHHRISYGCNSRVTRRMHSKEHAEKCTNKTVGTHILEDKVFDLLREYATDPVKLKEHLAFFQHKQKKQGKIPLKIYRLQKQITDIEDDKLKLVDKYVSGAMSQEAYVTENSEQDKRLTKFKNKLNTLQAKTSLLHNRILVETSVQKFCDSIKAQIDRNKTFDAKRQFLIKHIDKVVYNKYRVVLHGSVPILHQGKSDELPFTIHGVIDTSKLHTGPRRQFVVDSRLREWGSGGRDVEMTIERKEELQLPAIRAAQLTQKTTKRKLRDKQVNYTSKAYLEIQKEWIKERNELISNVIDK